MDKRKGVVDVRKDHLTKKDLKSFKEEIVHQFHLISEGLIDQIKLLAERHSGIIQRLEHIDKENKLLAEGYTGIIERLDHIEKENKLLTEGQLGIIQRIDRMEKENERQHLETRALVKISFSEVDKRVCDLES